MSKKKSVLIILIVSFISLLFALLFEYLNSSSDSFSILFDLIIAAIPVIIVMLILFILLKSIEFFEIENDEDSRYIKTGYISFLIVSILMFNYIKSGSTLLIQIKNYLSIFLLSLFYVGLVILLLMCTVKKHKKVKINPESYFLKRIPSEKENPDNLPVTYENLYDAENYFDSNDSKNIYLKYADKIQQVAEDKVKEIIFENDLQNEINGEWFLSRIDFDNSGFNDLGLIYFMTFVEKKRVIRRMNFVTISDKIVSSEYLQFICYFDYDSKNQDMPFSFSDYEVEFLK